MNIPSNLKYTKDHERLFVLVRGSFARRPTATALTALAQW